MLFNKQTNKQTDKAVAAEARVEKITPLSRFFVCFLFLLLFARAPSLLLRARFSCSRKRARNVGWRIEKASCVCVSTSSRTTRALNIELKTTTNFVSSAKTRRRRKFKAAVAVCVCVCVAKRQSELCVRATKAKSARSTRVPFIKDSPEKVKRE